MKYKFDGHNWIIRLERGELLMESLTKLVKEQDIKGGWISGLGAASWAELAYYDPVAKGYESKKLDELLEITSLQGNVAWEAPLDSGKPFLHIHGTFANAEMRAYGGHIMELEVGGTCEIFLHHRSKGGPRPWPGITSPSDQPFAPKTASDSVRRTTGTPPSPESVLARESSGQPGEVIPGQGLTRFEDDETGLKLLDL